MSNRNNKRSFVISKKKIFSIFLLYLILSGDLTACKAKSSILSVQNTLQGIVIKGNVIDGFGYVVEGADIFVKGNKQNKTITDIEGNYSITVKKESDILVFSKNGYIEKEVTIGTQREINVELKIDRDGNIKDKKHKNKKNTKTRKRKR